MSIERRKKMMHLAIWLGICTLSVPAVAHAQIDREMTTLAQKAVTWMQGIAMSLCILAVIRAGLAFLDEEKAPHAWGRMRTTLFGCAVVYGAVGIVQFIKAHFGVQVY